ncbi:MAG: CRTAC1 family protein [bacterium]|nr:CRTAC1 family protein [bacterium]
MRPTHTARLVLLLAIATAGLACRAGGDAPSAALFEDVTPDVGLDFVHVNGMSGELYLCEMMGPGAALFDYDGDGDLDAFIVQGHHLGAGGVPDDAPGDRLFANQLVESGVLRFRDVTAEAALDSRGYSMGVAAGDYDADGHVDLYVTRFGDNVLWRNVGDGTFAERTIAAGVAESRWSVSASFVDTNGDGLLDLYVGNYLDFTLQNHKKCSNLREDYCSPKRYNPLPDRLFVNRGDGTFEDRSEASRIAGSFGGALGVVGADLDDDARIDLYVANDGMENQLWRNRGDGTFEDIALLAGSALNDMGQAEAGMGLDADDYDNDGDLDLFVAHLATETNTLYRNAGDGTFEDATIASGLAASSLPFTAFGAGWIDVDNDGFVDLLVVNGAVTLVEELVLRGDPFPLHQRNQLFRNLGDGTFEDWSSAGGEPFSHSEVSRGAAFGDVDNDGDVDALVLNNGGPARLLLNRIGQDNRWVGLRLVGGEPQTDRIGARVLVELSDGRRIQGRAHTDGSYASASDPRVLLGLGPSTIESVRVHWPAGATERFEDVEIDSWNVLREGGGAR